MSCAPWLFGLIFMVQRHPVLQEYCNTAAALPEAAHPTATADDIRVKGLVSGSQLQLLYQKGAWPTACIRNNHLLTALEVATVLQDAVVSAEPAPCVALCVLMHAKQRTALDKLECDSPMRASLSTAAGACRLCRRAV